MYWPTHQLIIKDSSLTVLDARERWNSIMLFIWAKSCSRPCSRELPLIFSEISIRKVNNLLAHRRYNCAFMGLPRFLFCAIWGEFIHRCGNNKMLCYWEIKEIQRLLIWETVPDSKINLPLDLTAEFEKRHSASRRRALTEMLCLRRRGHLPMLRRP